jgi:hypothetical protein
VPVEEHAEPQPEHAPKRPAARAADGPPAHQLLDWQRLAGNRAVLAVLGRSEPAVPVQRLMVRMPNPFGQGVHNMVGDAEVDEIEESLTAKGAAGAGGKHQWEDSSWTFPPAPTTEASVFYGHGNRAKLGEFEPIAFVAAVSDAQRQLKEDTAFKFVACGGGVDQAADGAAYGAEVADYLRVSATSGQGGGWSGALKATEGLVYYTNTYKTVLPGIPPAIDKLLTQRTATAESNVRKKVAAEVRDRLIAVDPVQRARDFAELRDLAAARYARGPTLASRAVSVRAIDVPAAGLPGKWVKTKLNGAMDTLFGGNVGWLDLQLVFLESFSSGNCLDGVHQILEGMEKDMREEAAKIWAEFRDALQHEAAVLPRSAGPAAKIGTLDAQAQPGAQDRFAKWQDFGDVLWARWKASRTQGGGDAT